MITIKKYPNRRLYDTSASEYINLDTIKQYILQHKEFEVVDSKTGKDLTRSMLLQLITELESNENQAILTDNLLKQLIRFYGGDMQGYLRQYLEQSLSAFIEQQETMQNMMNNFMNASPMGMFNKMMEQNMKNWTGSGKGGKE